MNYVDQLNRILSLLGKPTPEMQQRIGSDLVKKYLENVPGTDAVPLKKVYPDARCVVCVARRRNVFVVLPYHT